MREREPRAARRALLAVGPGPLAGLDLERVQALCPNGRERAASEPVADQYPATGDEPDDVTRRVRSVGS